MIDSSVLCYRIWDKDAFLIDYLHIYCLSGANSKLSKTRFNVNFEMRIQYLFFKEINVWVLTSNFTLILLAKRNNYYPHISLKIFVIS